jgi:uncharacterized membrane protein
MTRHGEHDWEERIRDVLRSVYDTAERNQREAEEVMEIGLM